MMEHQRQRGQNIFDLNIEENNEIKKRVYQFNNKMRRNIKTTTKPAYHNINITIPIPIQNDFQKVLFKPFNPCLPIPPRNTSMNYKYSFYSNNFYLIYFLIYKDQKSMMLKHFEEAYKLIIPSQHHPIKNIGKFSKIGQLKENLFGFVDAGIQIKVIVQDSTLNNITICQKMLQNNQIIQVRVYDQSQLIQRLPQYKYKKFDSIQQQTKKIVNDIKSQHYKKKGIYYNFASLQSESSEVFKKKKIMQDCIKPKQKSQQLKNHEDFTQYLKNYKNVKLLKQLLQCSYQNNNQNLKKIKQIQKNIQIIQKQQKDFCDYFKKRLQYASDPIQNLPTREKEDIYFRMIKQYKNEHSIYELINNSIRFSTTINQQQITHLSTFIKYLFESVLYFFEKLKIKVYQKYKKKFQQQQQRKKQQQKQQTKQQQKQQQKKQPKFYVFRGGIMSNSQYDSYQEGSIIMNLGFMSTSSERKTAQKFIPKDNSQPYNSVPILMVIDIPLSHKTYDGQLEGFVQMAELFNLMNQEQKHQFKGIIYDTNQQEVLFNPLNIFQVVKKQKNFKISILHLKYAPQVQLFKEIKSGNMDPQKKKKFQLIQANLCSLKKTSYDRGVILCQKGQPSKALQFYEKAEKNGQTLTDSQKMNKIDICKQNKDFDKVDGLIKQMVQTLQKKQLQLSKLKNSQKQLKLSDQIAKITILTNQSSLLQTTSNFFKAQQKALKANQQYRQLEKKIKEKRKCQDVIHYYVLGISTCEGLAKSRLEKVDNINSIIDCLQGFIYIDTLYKIVQRIQIPKCKGVKGQLQFIDSKEVSNIIKIQKDKIEQLSQQKQQKLLKKIIKQEEEQSKIKEEIKKYREQQKKFQNIINQYFRSRKGRQQDFYIFLKAANQVDKLISYKGEQFKKVVDILSYLKENAQSIRNSQRQLYTILKQNLRIVNKDKTQCLKKQKQLFYRLDRKSNYQQIIRDLKQQIKQVNTQKIREYNRLTQFLLEYQYVQKDEQQKKEIKKLRQTVSQLLFNKLNDSDKLKLTSQKTEILLTQAQQYKNNCIDSNILEWATSKYQASKSQNGDINSSFIFRTTAGMKDKDNFEKLRTKIDMLKEIHEKDKQINTGYYLMCDLVNQVEILNNCQSCVGTPQKFKELIQQAYQKIQAFKQKYMNIYEGNLNEKLAELYYQQAKNKLKRGYFQQAQILIKRTRQKLQSSYTNQGKKSDSDFNTLCARNIMIKIYKLESQIFGIYGQPNRRFNLYKQLVIRKEFIEKEVAHNIQGIAIINEAVIFLAVRLIPKNLKLPPELKKICKDTYENIDRAVNLRSGLLGAQNEFTAISYSYKMFIQSVQQDDRIQQTFNKTKRIYECLENDKNGNVRVSHLEKQPMLFLYKMMFQVSYLSAMYNKQIQDCYQAYKNNMHLFIQHNKGIKSLVVAEYMLETGSFLSKNKAYQKESQKYLQECQKQIQSLMALNQNNNQAQTSIKVGQLKSLQKKLCLTCVNFFAKIGKKEMLKKYQRQIQQIYQQEIRQNGGNSGSRGNRGNRRNNDVGFFEHLVDTFSNCFFGYDQRYN